MSVTLDANVLVYASNEADPAHQPVRSLLDRLATSPDLVYLFWPVLMGYLRIVTHPAILPSPLSPREATENVTSLLARPHVHAPGEESGFWELYLKSQGDSVRGNDVPDAHIATLMRQYGVSTIYSRDRGFRRFEGIDVRDPLA